MKILNPQFLKSVIMYGLYACGTLLSVVYAKPLDDKKIQDGENYNIDEAYFIKGYLDHRNAPAGSLSRVPLHEILAKTDPKVSIDLAACKNLGHEQDCVIENLKNLRVHVNGECEEDGNTFSFKPGVDSKTGETNCLYNFYKYLNDVQQSVIPAVSTPEKSANALEQLNNCLKHYAVVLFYGDNITNKDIEDQIKHLYSSGDEINLRTRVLMVDSNNAGEINKFINSLPRSENVEEKNVSFPVKIHVHDGKLTRIEHVPKYSVNESASKVKGNTKKQKFSYNPKPDASANAGTPSYNLETTNRFTGLTDELGRA